MKAYNAIIIGAGQAGSPLALRLAAAGWKTALIEKRWVGGTCVNDGCTPTKTMIASARTAYIAGRMNEYGVKGNFSGIDITSVLDRKNKVVSQFRTDLQKRLEANKQVDFYQGTAQFISAKQIQITGLNGHTKSITAEHIFINTGTRPRIPVIDGIAHIPYFTSTTLMDEKVIPDHLLILGGGYISMEFGQMYRRFGSKVTILEQAPQLLSHEDDDVVAAISKMLQEDSITVYKNVTMQKADQQDGEIVLSFSVDGKQQQLSGSHWLIATGRIPNTEDLQLQKAGIETDDKGFIKTNDLLQTSVPGIYALGDVKGGPAFTHISYNDYVIVAGNLLEQRSLSTNGRPVPYCMFTDPELGRIGMTEKEARNKGFEVQVATLPMTSVARGIEANETRGLLKAIVDKKTKHILGAAVLAVQGGELMTVLQMAMMGNLTYEQLQNAVFAHPTYAEALNNLFASLE